MEVRGGEAVLIALGCLAVLIKVGVEIGGHLDELIESPGLAVYESDRILKVKGLEKIHIVVDRIHKVKDVGRDVARDEEERIVDRAGFYHTLRPPGLLEVEVAVINGIDVLKKTVNAEHSCGTGIGSDDVVVGAARVAVLNVVCECRTVRVITLLHGPFESYAETFLNRDVTAVDSVLDHINAGLLLENLEFGTLNVLPAEDGNGLALVVDLVGKIVAEITVFVLGVVNGDLFYRSFGLRVLRRGGLFAALSVCAGGKAGNEKNYRADNSEYSCKCFHRSLLE